jgi:hypothetical protein
MDAGTYSISSEKSHTAAAARPPLQEAGTRPYMPSLSTGSRNPSAKCYVSHLFPESQKCFAGARRVFDDSPDRAGLFPCCRAIGSSRTGRRWIWTWRTTCSRSPGGTRRTRWQRPHPRRRTGGCSPRSCSTTGHASLPSGTSRLCLRTSRQPSQLPLTMPSWSSSVDIFPRYVDVLLDLPLD